MQFPEFPGVHPFNCLLEVRDTATLRAGLEDAFLAMNGIGQFLTSSDGDAARLFAIDVFACFCGHHGCCCMPPVTGCDQHRIDIFPVQQFAEITKKLTVCVSIVLVDQFLASVTPRGLNVGNGNALNIFKWQHRFKVISATWPDSDNSECYFFARCDRSITAQHMRWHECCHSSSGSDTLQNKISTRVIGWLCHELFPWLL